MRAYSNVKVVESRSAGKSASIFHRRKQHIFGICLAIMLTFSCMGISVSSSPLATEVRRITAYWLPNLTELGKLKYVTSDESEQEVAASISELAYPFTNAYVSEIEEGLFEVNGLGGMIVRACLKGRVEKIDVDGSVKQITISHGNNLKSVYGNIDTLGVKEGDGVEKNTPIGISESSKITFKILYKGKFLAGLTAGDGEFSFL